MPSGSPSDSLFPEEEIIAYTDGASRGNPGPASYGVVIQDARGRTIETLSEYVGTATNNVAEYRALLAAMEYASEKHVQKLKIYCDSELITRQMQGRYRVQSPDLKPLYERARQLAKRFDDFSIQNLPREQNREADRLANEALDSARRYGPKNPRPTAPLRGSSDAVLEFSAVAEQGKLRPTSPAPRLEEGVEYDIRAKKRTIKPGE